MATEKADVVIVGVGAAGGVLAAELSKSGMKVMGLERGPRLTTQDFNPHDELRYFQRQDLRPNIKRQPITWRPNPNARANPIPVQNYGNQAGGGTVHYGAVSWRFHEDDFRARSQTIGALRRGGHPRGFFAGGLAAELCRSRALLRSHRVRDRRVGQSRQSAGTQGRGRQRVRSTAPPRISAAAVARGPGRRRLRCRNQEARLSSILDAARDPVGVVQGTAGLHLLRLLPGVRMSCRRQVEHARDRTAGGGCDRQLQAHHRRHVLPRQQRQQRTCNRGRLLRAQTARTTRSRPSSSSSRRSSTTMCAFCCCRRPRNSPTVSPTRAGRWAST